MRSKIALFILASAAMVAGSAQAASLSVLLDHSTRLPVVGAASVLVTNPAVADVTVVDSHTVYVAGRSQGSTNIIVLDTLGRTVFSGDVRVSRAGAPVAVYRGVERTDFTCAENCAKDQAPAPANPFAALMGSVMSQAAAAAPTPAPAGGVVAASIHP
jgi:hypothetical protein